MLSFKEWVEFNRKKKNKESGHEPAVSQSHREGRNENQQGEADRGNQAVAPERVFVFREP